MCRDNPLEQVFPLPWVESTKDLVSTLEVASGLPNRVIPCEPNLDAEEGENIGFDPKLEDDAFGKMAEALKVGRSVINQTMKVPCSHGFYNKVITTVWHPDSVVLLRLTAVDKLFPCEPISIKAYAMTTVPVLLDNNEEFHKLTGIEDDKVKVMSATDFIPRTVPFMGFYKLMTGSDAVFCVEPEKFSGPPPMLWRYNRAYRVNYVAEIL